MEGLIRIRVINSDLDPANQFGSLRFRNTAARRQFLGRQATSLIANSIVFSQWIKKTRQYRYPTTSQRSYKFRILRSLLKQCSQTELTRKLKPSRKGGPGIDSLPLQLSRFRPSSQDLCELLWEALTTGGKVGLVPTPATFFSGTTERLLSTLSSTDHKSECKQGC